MQYGDCKDKTTLLISMLNLVGIKAYPVLISVAPHERVDTTLPLLSQFNHMIAAIPTTTNAFIWLDSYCLNLQLWLSTIYHARTHRISYF